MAINAKNIIVRREALAEEGNIDACDFLSIYNRDNGELILRSDCSSVEDWIELSYEQLVFVAAPGYKEETIYIQWNSILNLINS